MDVKLRFLLIFITFFFLVRKGCILFIYLLFVYILYIYSSIHNNYFKMIPLKILKISTTAYSKLSNIAVCVHSKSFHLKLIRFKIHFKHRFFLCKPNSCQKRGKLKFLKKGLNFLSFFL